MEGAEKLEPIERPDIYQYHEYRSFLKDWIEYLQFVKGGFSIRQFALRSGLSANYIGNVLSGRAPLSIKGLTALEKSLELNKPEFAFLQNLVQLVDARNLEDQKSAFNKIVKTGNFRIKNKKGLASYQYISSWVHVAIRELLMLLKRTPNETWIQKKLENKVSVSEIREIMEFLEDNDLLKREKMGAGAESGRIFPKGPFYKLALSEFYKQNYELCLRSIYRVERDKRYLTSHTAAMSEESFDKVREAMAECLEKINSITAQDKGKKKRIYHFSLFGFPYTKELENE